MSVQIGKIISKSKKRITPTMASKLKQIPRQPTLTETTADLIRDAIIAGELALGVKLSEKRLSDKLKVSRSPVHDALAILQSEGLVTVSPKSGSYVFTPDLEEVDDLCEHRCLLETASLRRAFIIDRERLIDDLCAAVKTMQSAVEEEDPFKYTRGDIEFHNSIIRNGGNRSIASAYRRTISPVMALRTHLFTNMSANTSRPMDEHGALIAACRDDDVEMACKIVEEHTGHLVEAYRIALEQN